MIQLDVSERVAIDPRDSLDTLHPALRDLIAPDLRAPVAAVVRPISVPCSVEMHRVGTSEWDALIETFDGLSQDQTWAYGRRRWPTLRHEPLLFTRDGEIVGGALIKIQKLPLGLGSIAVAKWGPMLRHGDHPQRSAIYRDMIAALVAEYAERRRFMLSVLPRGTAQAFNDEFDTMMSSGFRPGPANAFPDRYFVNLSIAEDMQRKSLDQKWRYHLRKSESAGLTFEPVGAERVEDFARIYDAMGARKKFQDHSGYDTLQDMLTLPDATRPELFLVRQGDELVAGAIVFKAGDTAVYLYGATTDRALPLRAGYFMQWQIVCWLSQNTRAKWYDLGGSEGFNGLHQFKKGLVGSAGVISALPPMANYGRTWPLLIGTGALAMREIALKLRHRWALRFTDQARPDQARKTAAG